MKTRRLTVATLVAGMLSLVLGQLACANGGTPPTTHTVTIKSTSYSPRSLVVDVGDTIVWVNEDLLVHTATSKAGGFDSGDIAAGKSWKHKVRRKGAFPYLCSYHPPMRGEIRVR